MKWIKDMTTSARLFHTVDVIAALTGISFDRSRYGKVDELVHYVTGRRSMPEKGSMARRQVVSAIRSQLPCGINQFGILDLISLIMQINRGQQEDQLRKVLVQILEDRYGPQMTLSPEQDFETSSTGLTLLRQLAERPDATISLE